MTFVADIVAGFSPSSSSFLC